VDIHEAQLTRYKKTRILTQSLLTTNLKELNILDNGAIGREEPPMHPRRRATLRKKYFRKPDCQVSKNN